MVPNTLDWLLEDDPTNPGVRLFALRDLLGLVEDDRQVKAAQSSVMASGPVPTILASQLPDGSWPGGDWKYRGAFAQVAILAELGADGADKRVGAACEYVLGRGLAANGAFGYGERPTASKAVHCHNGQMIAGLARLGWAADPRFGQVVDWQSRTITGEEPIRYYRSGTSGPAFACAANLKQPCGWGAVKALKGFATLSPENRTPLVERAIAVGVEFLLGRNPAEADYPYTERVSRTWFKFGFPLSYWADVLEIAEVLGALGYREDPRLQQALAFITSKRDGNGRWRLENHLNGKMWVDIEAAGAPSKWVTLRALRALGPGAY